MAQESPHYNLITILRWNYFRSIPSNVITAPSDLNVTDGQRDGHCGITAAHSDFLFLCAFKYSNSLTHSPRSKNKEINYRGYYRYHRYFKSKIPVYGPSLLTIHTPCIWQTINWSHPFPQSFLRAYSVHVCPSAQRAINNIYSWLGVPARGIRLRHDSRVR